MPVISNAIGDGQKAIAPNRGHAAGAITDRADLIPDISDATSGGQCPIAESVGRSTSAVAGRADLILDIRKTHQRRVFAMGQRKRIDLALGAYVRRQLGWHKELPKPERDRIAKAAAKVIKECDEQFADIVAANELSRESWVAIERSAVKGMEKLAEQLPAWQSFGAAISGFGRASLAVVVAEAGDLSNYPTHSHLWKRLGLAVLEGRRQGAPVVNTVEEWQRHGYSPRRRSLIWNIGDALIKGNRDGRYRTVYLARKAYEIARDPEIKPIVAHRRAQRYMEKRLIRDLWSAWRKI